MIPMINGNMINSLENRLHHDFHSLSLPGNIQAKIARGATDSNATMNICLSNKTKNATAANIKSVPPNSQSTN